MKKMTIQSIFTMLISISMLVSCKDSETKSGNDNKDNKETTSKKEDKDKLKEEKIEAIQEVEKVEETTDQKYGKLIAGIYTQSEQIDDMSFEESKYMINADNSYTYESTSMRSRRMGESEEINVRISGKWTIENETFIQTADEVESNNESLKKSILDKKESRNKIVELSSKKLVLMDSDNKKQTFKRQ